MADTAGHGTKEMTWSGRTGKVSLTTIGDDNSEVNYSWYVTVNFNDDGKPINILVTCDPSQDRTVAALLSVIFLLASTLLQLGMSWERLRSMIGGWTFPPFGYLNGSFHWIGSPLQGIVEWLDKTITEHQG